MSDAPRTTLISVCYNSLAVLPDMLGSVPAGCPVILIDNASDDHAAIAQLAGRAGARLIRNPENRGFGAACNIGAEEARTEFLLFLNPDATLEEGCLTALEDAMDRFPRASAMNPRIRGANGRTYFKHRSVLLPRRDHMPRGWPASDCEVTVLSGAALMVRRKDFEAIGGFDPEIFLYHEDDDLSLRLRAERGPLMFIREATVRHEGGRSTQRSPEVAALKARHMGRSRVYAARKHGRPWPFGTALLFSLAAIANPLRMASARSRAKQRGFCAGVLSMWCK